MANIKQQKKRVDIAARQRLENLRYRSTIKTLAKRLETAVADGDEAAVAAEHRELVRTIDKATARGALHRNTGGAQEGPGRARRQRQRRLVAPCRTLVAVRVQACAGRRL